jgi:Lon protease-like protein
MSMNRAYRDPNEMPMALPIFPLAGALLLPRGELPLNVFEQR